MLNLVSFWRRAKKWYPWYGLLLKMMPKPGETLWFQWPALARAMAKHMSSGLSARMAWAVS